MQILDLHFYLFCYITYMNKVGVLALQGNYKDHLQVLKRLNIKGIEVNEIKDLTDLTHLIIPGGESTTISLLLKQKGFKEALNKDKLKIFGTCAGAIILSSSLIKEKKADYDIEQLKLIDVEISRNAYGSQLDSFKKILLFENEKEYETFFIRAPKIIKVGDKVRILSKLNEDIVIARNENVLISTHHPELCYNNFVHEYFLSM